MPGTVEQVDFVSGFGSSKHTFFSKMIVRPLSMQDSAIQSVCILLKRVLLLLCHKEDDLVVVLRSDNAARNGVVAGVSLQIGEGVARVLTRD